VEKQQAASPLHLVDPLKGKEGTAWDKPAPDGPPNPPTRSIPPHLKKVIRFFESIIADESLLLDLCVDRAVSIVKFNYEKRLVGQEMLMEQPTTGHFIQMAAPLATELYKQVLASVEANQAEYNAIREEAMKELENASRPSSPIFVP